MSNYAIETDAAPARLSPTLACAAHRKRSAPRSKVEHSYNLTREKKESGTETRCLRSLIIPFQKNPSVSWACVISILLFLLFCGLQATGSSVLSLPVQWLGISVLPILLALIVGGYVGKFKAAGIEFEPGMRRLPYVPP